jgi:hypothetical protein
MRSRPLVANPWTGWFAVVVGLLLIGEFVISRDVVPALIYRATLPSGVAALKRGTPTSVGTSASFDQQQH